MNTVASIIAEINGQSHAPSVLVYSSKGRTTGVRGIVTCDIAAVASTSPTLIFTAYRPYRDDTQNDVEITTHPTLERALTALANG